MPAETEFDPETWYLNGEALPPFANYWFAVSPNAWLKEPSLWETRFQSWYDEIDFKLDTCACAPYAHDARIFRLCALRLLEHLVANREEAERQCADKST